MSVAGAEIRLLTKPRAVLNFFLIARVLHSDDWQSVSHTISFAVRFDDMADAMSIDDVCDRRRWRSSRSEAHVEHRKQLSGSLPSLPFPVPLPDPGLLRSFVVATSRL